LINLLWPSPYLLAHHTRLLNTALAAAILPYLLLTRVDRVADIVVRFTTWQPSILVLSILLSCPLHLTLDIATASSTFAEMATLGPHMAYDLDGMSVALLFPLYLPTFPTLQHSRQNVFVATVASRSRTVRLTLHCRAKCGNMIDMGIGMRRQRMETRVDDGGRAIAVKD